MSDSWMYDGFPLYRADKTTRGNDYRYVINSLDAAIRHVFGFPAGIPLTPAFSIGSDGKVEVLESLTIGSDIEIDEIIGEIDDTPSADEDGQLATVTALRDFVDEAVDAAIEAADRWVLKVGDTMTGALNANGGIVIGPGETLSSATQLDIVGGTILQLFGGSTDTIFCSGHLVLGTDWNLKMYRSGVPLSVLDIGADQFSVGTTMTDLKLVGDGPRPLWNGTDSVALVSDLEETGMGGYVPIAGGTFTGRVWFEGGIQFDTGEKLYMEDGGGTGYAVLEMDGFGSVSLNAPGANSVDINATAMNVNADININSYTLAASSGTDLDISHTYFATNIRGSGTRPTYNTSEELALLSDTLGSLQAGQGININDLGGSVYEVEVGDSEVTSAMINAAGSENQVLSLDSGGDFDWHDTVQSITGGTGITASSGTGDVTVSVTAGSIGATQLGTNAVTQVKVADDAIGPDELTADNGSLEAGVDYFLTNNTDTLSWTDSRLTGILGTLEIFMGITNGTDQDTNTTTNWEDVFNQTNGPYMIQRIWYTGTTGGGYGTEISIIIDTIEVIDDSDNITSNTNGEEHIGPDSVEDLKFPIFAKSSLQIRHKATSAGFGGTTHAQVVRLG